MNIGVCYAQADRQLWLQLDVPEGSTIVDGDQFVRVAAAISEIDLDSQKVGIYGKLAKLDTVVNEGDRVEIYRKITADPQQVQRRRVA